MKIMVVCGAWCSGASEITGYLSAAYEAYTCMPHIKMNEKIQTSSYDPIELGKILNDCIDENTFEILENNKFKILFEAWLKKQIDAAKNKMMSTLIIKHPLLAYFLEEVDEAIEEVNYILITRPFYKIDQRRLRRGWPYQFGSSGASKIYNKVYTFLHQNDKEYTVIPFEKFRDDKSFRQKIIKIGEKKPKIASIKFAEDARAKENSSNAFKILAQLNSQCIPKEEVTSEMIAQLYKDITPITPPDFSKLEVLLKGVNSQEVVLGDMLCGAIIETRSHKNIPFVIENFLKHTNAKICFFHGKDNKDFILNHLTAEQLEKIVLVELNCHALTARDYNAILLSKKFWNALPTRGKVIIFQTDAMIANNSDYKLHHFLRYDCIGAAFEKIRPLNIITQGGNGGFSLRDWNKCFACLDQFDVKLWKGGEDDFFNFHIELIGGLVASREECSRFGTQAEFKHKSFSIHQPRLLTEKNKKKLLAWEPEAINLLV